MFGSQVAIAVISIIAGLIVCFQGYRVFKAVLGIAGFIAGAALVFNFSAMYTGNMIVLVIAAIFGGMIGASLALAFYFVGLFLIGALAGWQLGLLLSTALPVGTVLLLPAVAAVVLGIVACFLQRPVITVATAMIGAWSVVTGLFYFFGSGIIPTDLFRHPATLIENMRETDPMVLFGWIALSIAGIIFQSSRRRKEKAGGKE